MNVKPILRALAAAALAALFAGGCFLFTDPVSKGDRVEMFMRDVNAQRYEDLADHLHPNHSERNTADTYAYWDNEFGGATMNYDNLSVSGDTVTIEVSSSAAEHDGTWEFTMKEDEPDVWFINYIENLTYGAYINNG